MSLETGKPSKTSARWAIVTLRGKRLIIIYGGRLFSSRQRRTTTRLEWKVFLLFLHQSTVRYGSGQITSCICFSTNFCFLSPFQCEHLHGTTIGWSCQRLSSWTVCSLQWTFISIFKHKWRKKLTCSQNESREVVENLFKPRLQLPARLKVNISVSLYVQWADSLVCWFSRWSAFRMWWWQMPTTWPSSHLLF